MSKYTSVLFHSLVSKNGLGSCGCTRFMISGYHMGCRTSSLGCTDFTAKRPGQRVPIVLTGSIFSNTDLSDLSIVGTCDIFVYQKRHKVTEPDSLKWPREESFQKCLCA